MGGDTNRIAVAMCDEFNKELREKWKDQNSIQGEITAIAEKLKILTSPSHEEQLKLRQQGEGSSETFGIPDKELREQYRKDILAPLRSRQQELEKRLKELAKEIPSPVKGLERAIRAVGQKQYTILRLAGLSWSLERILEAFRERKAGQDIGVIGEKELDSLMELEPGICEEDIEKEYHKLKDEGLIS